ncbi:MAG: hypothetical protein OEZ20_09410, partial [candidate division WOR-3 bacterium]|nr:hypothetical protein [candidate division WOR-3 bacterium]
MHKSSVWLIPIVLLTFSISQSEPIWHPFANKGPEAMTEINIPNSDNYRTTVTIDIPGFLVEEETVDGINYHHISIPILNGGTLTEEGSPQLPLIARFIAIPPDRDPEIRITEKIEETFVGYNVYPYQPPLPDVPEAQSSQTFTLNEKRYTTDAFYPEAFVTSDDPAIIRDYRVIPLIIQPVRYNPVTKELVIARHIQIELTYSR